MGIWIIKVVEGFHSQDNYYGINDYNSICEQGLLPQLFLKTRKNFTQFYNILQKATLTNLTQKSTTKILFSNI